MNFLRRFKFLTYLLVLLSLVGFTYASGNYGLMFMGVVAVGVSWWLVEKGNAPPVPRWIINTSVLLIAMLLFWELVIYRQPNLLLGLGHFIFGLIICKLFETKSNRDYGQIMILSLLLVLSAAILSTSPIFAMVLLAYLAVGLYVSLIFHLQCETQRAMARHAGADLMMTASGQQNVIARDLRRLSTGVGLFLFFFACMVFVLFPRSGVNQLFANWHISGGPVKTGFSRHVTMGQLGTLQQSNARVAVVTIEKNGRNIGNQGYQPYFIGGTLNVYDGLRHEWIRSFKSMRSNQKIRLFSKVTAPLVSPALYDPNSVITETFTFNQLQANTLFAIGPAVKLSGRDLGRVLRLNDGSMICSPRHSGPITYTITTAEKYSPNIIGPQHPRLFPTAMRYQPFDLDTMSPIRSAPIPHRVAALAAKIAGPLLAIHRTRANIAHVDMLLAKRFCNYLSAHYPYSFDMTPVDPNMDPTEDFLFNKKKIGGYCEFFASAMVMFCRSVKIPARMATGYHGGDYNPIAGYYVIRQKFAHAWVQAYIPGRGWVNFDPSPASSLTSIQRKLTWFTEVGDFFQWIRLQWLQSIISFNESMRRNIIHKVETFTKAVAHTFMDVIHHIEFTLQVLLTNRHVGTRERILFFIGAMGVVALGLFFLHLWQKQRKSLVVQMVRGMERKLQRQLTRDLAFFDRLVDILSRIGIERDETQTPQEYVQAATLAVGTDLPEARQLIRIFYDIRYGGLSVSAALGQHIRENLTDLERRIRGIGPIMPTTVDEHAKPTYTHRQ